MLPLPDPREKPSPLGGGFSFRAWHQTGRPLQSEEGR